jgi:aspartate/methionine/tyrosine aminotransferase
MANLQIHVTTSVSQIAQAAALAALKGPRDWLEQAVRTYEARRNMLVDELSKIKGINCFKPEGGRCAFPNVGYFGMSSLEFAKYLLKEADVLVIPTLTRHYGARAEQHVKVGFCRPEETIKEAMKRINRALEKLKP